MASGVLWRFSHSYEHIAFTVNDCAITVISGKHEAHHPQVVSRRGLRGVPQDMSMIVP